MRIPKLRQGNCIEVEWIDANSPHPSVWINPCELVTKSPVMTIRSVGYYFDKQDGYVCITGDEGVAEEYVGMLNRVFYIPIGCIRKITVLDGER